MRRRGEVGGIQSVEQVRVARPLTDVVVAPGVAHDSASITHNWNRHYKRLAKMIFYTKRQANVRFLTSRRIIETKPWRKWDVRCSTL
jgi:hypothetical protein